MRIRCWACRFLDMKRFSNETSENYSPNLLEGKYLTKRSVPRRADMTMQGMQSNTCAFYDSHTSSAVQRSEMRYWMVVDPER